MRKEVNTKCLNGNRLLFCSMQIFSWIFKSFPLVLGILIDKCHAKPTEMHATRLYKQVGFFVDFFCWYSLATTEKAEIDWLELMLIDINFNYLTSGLFVKKPIVLYGTFGISMTNRSIDYWSTWRGEFLTILSCFIFARILGDEYRCSLFFYTTFSMGEYKAEINFLAASFAYFGSCSFWGPSDSNLIRSRVLESDRWSALKSWHSK